MKHVVRLSEIEPHRQIVFDAFDLSKGHLINQKKLRTQATAFLHDIGAAFTADAVNNAVYRLRLMVGHMKKF